MKNGSGMPLPCETRSCYYRTWTFSAWSPLGPLVTVNCTAWPSCRLRNPPAWMAEKCTKTSSPDWRLMNPYPFASLNHFTVPCSNVVLFSVVNLNLLRRIAGERWYRFERTDYQPRVQTEPVRIICMNEPELMQFIFVWIYAGRGLPGPSPYRRLAGGSGNTRYCGRSPSRQPA